MKKIYLKLLLAFTLFANASAVFAAAFTPGNIVVMRVGDGSAALTSAATAVFLDEYTTAGVLVQSIPLPTSASGANRTLTISGSSTSDGTLNLSTDKTMLTLTGYDAAAGTLSVTGTTSTANNRVVGIVNAAGLINSTTALTDAASANNFRGAVTNNGTDLWVIGAGGGIRYTTVGSTTSTQLATTPTNVRTIAIYNNQLYFGSATGTFQGVSALGTGLPTTSGQTATLLNGFPTTTNQQSTYGFDLKPNTSDVLYVGDDGTNSTAPGIQKWVLAAGTWTRAYTLSPGASIGVRGLTVNWSGANPVIFATSTDGKIVTVTDAGSASLVTTIATAGTNTAIRGIAFAPVSVPAPVTLLSFEAKKVNDGNQLIWTVANEIDVDRYEVEKSNDNLAYQVIGTVRATRTNTYSFTDTKATATNYYRLKTVDKNGKLAYSKIVIISNKSNAAIGSLYPTITTNKVTVDLFTTAATKVSYTVTNLGGQKLINQSAIITQNAKLNIDLSLLASGMYQVIMNTPTEQKIFKVVKQ